MNTYEVKTKQGTFLVNAWNESKALWAMSYEGYDVISIKENN
jgi:hypothetical protein